MDASPDGADDPEDADDPDDLDDPDDVELGASGESAAMTEL